MRELLLDEHRVELLSHGMDSCHNFEHLLEATLQQCITLPLHKFLFDKLKENLTSTGSYGQLEEAVENAKTKSPEDLGIRVMSTLLFLFYFKIIILVSLLYTIRP